MALVPWNDRGRPTDPSLSSPNWPVRPFDPMQAMRANGSNEQKLKEPKPEANPWAGVYETQRSQPQQATMREISAEDFAALMPEQQRMVEYNTIIDRAGRNGSAALDTLLGLAGTKYDYKDFQNGKAAVTDKQLAAMANPTVRDYRNDIDPRKHTLANPDYKNSAYARARSILDALGTKAEEAEAWRYGETNVDQLLGLVDKQRQTSAELLGQSLTTKPLVENTQQPVLEPLLRSLASTESGDWNAEGLLNILTQMQVDPATFYSFAAPYLDRFEAELATNPEASLATEGTQARKISDLRARLQIGG